MSAALFVVTLVIGIAVVLALIAVPFIVVFRRRYLSAGERLNSELELEGTLIPPSKGVYRGATAVGYPAVKNNGWMALTRRRVAFLTLTGKTIEIPLDTVIGFGEARVFKASVAGGWTHLVIRTAAGEIGFFTSDNAAWLAALREVTGLTPDASADSR